MVFVVWCAQGAATGVLARETEGSGSATVEFEDTHGHLVEGTHIRMPVDACGILRIRYRVGAQGMGTGGGIELLRESTQALPLPAAISRAVPVVTRCSRSTSRLVVQRSTTSMPHPVGLRLRVEGDALQAEDEVEIEIGAVKDGVPALVTDAVAGRRLRVHLRVDTDGDGVHEILERPLLIDLIAATASRFEIVAPSLIEKREQFEVVFRAEDLNANVDFGYRGSLRTWIERADGEQVWRPTASESLEIPTEVTFEIGGVVRVRGLARSSGVFWIAAQDGADRRGLSNPVRVVGEATQRLWWGDPHAHSADSDGVGTPEANYRFARDVAAIDFIALADRLEVSDRGVRLAAAHRGLIQSGLAVRRNIFQWWVERQASADLFDTAGRFVALHSFDWSGSPTSGGDRQVFLVETLPLPESTRLDGLHRILAERDRVENVLVVPHVERSDIDLGYHRPGLESAVQIYSSKAATEWLAQAALSRGYHVGFVAGSASRLGRAGHAVWQRRDQSAFWPHEMELPGGLTAVVAPTLDRQAIVRSVRQRRCYATTGARMLFDFAIDRQPMGELVNTRKPPEIRIEVHGTAAIERVDLIRDQVRLKTFWPRGRSFATDYRDESALPGRHYYYVRVIQTDGEMAWASPIWVTVSASGDSGQVVEAAASTVTHPAWNDDAAKPPRDVSAGGQGDAKSSTATADDTSVGDLVQATETLRALLAGQDGDRQWSAVEPAATIENRRGDFAVFRAKRDGKPVTIRLWTGFTAPRISILPGPAAYGPRPPD